MFFGEHGWYDASINPLNNSRSLMKKIDGKKPEIYLWQLNNISLIDYKACLMA